MVSCSKSDQPKTQEQVIDENAKKIYPLYLALEQRERKADQSVWAKELTAERCGQIFEDFWDALNTSSNKWDVLRRFATPQVTLPGFQPPRHLPLDILVAEPSGRNHTLDQDAWQSWTRSQRLAGWQIGNTEFRHKSFDPSPSGPSSDFYVCFELSNPVLSETAAIEGILRVQWDPFPQGTASPTIRVIDASRLSMRSRRGEFPFERVFDESIPEREKWPFVDPLILYDLDGDGLSEIILAARNLVIRLQDWKIKAMEPLCKIDPGHVDAALIADFNQDGFADFLCARPDGLFLYEGSAQGKFDQPPRLVWDAKSKIRYSLAMTCGDIDGDGDLDIWLTQYKVPYLLGQIPTPYFDANDGHPSFLLRNNGDGTFADVTEESGLSAKRNRRTYSASFADLDGDGDLDLAVISDFSGLDLYQNDGKGHFTDVTQAWAGEPYGAGMAHAIADFDRDGRLDLLMMGMTSATVDRLESMGLKRGDSKIDESKRAKLMSGNRLLMAKPKGGFTQTALSESIARSGWSWGCGVLDFDNDGFADVYIANGHETGPSVRDYESQYWLHDLYVGTSSVDAVHLTYFSAKAGATRGRGYSFGGWDRNRFYWNDRGKQFIEIGPLLGLSLQKDCRNVVADDLDGDGRVDLLVTTFEAWPQKKQTLQIYRNRTREVGDWIGVRLREEKNSVSPVGARVTLYSNAGSTTRQIIVGDSYRSQTANTVHFGLGKNAKVDRIEVRWINGEKSELFEPAPDHYYDVAHKK